MDPNEKKNRPLMCPPDCWGCRYIDYNPIEEYQLKENWLKKILSEHVSAISSINTNSKHHLGLRDKSSLRAHFDNSRWRFGLTRYHNQSYEFLPLNNCPIQTPRVNQIYQLLESLPPQIPLAQVQIQGQQLALVLKMKPIKNIRILEELKNFLLLIKPKLEALEIETLWFNFHPQFGKWSTLNKGWLKFWGPDFSKHPNGDSYSAQGFGQVNQELYNLALSSLHKYFLSDYHISSYLELYCGIGSGLRKFSSSGITQLLGVELSGFSLKAAEINSPGARLLQGKCEDRVPQIDHWYQQEAKAGKVGVFINPPRSGVHSKVLSWLAQLKPGPLAYLSCSPLSLNKDLSGLKENGFIIKSITPYDFFPKTRHLECLVFLEKLS